MLTCTVCGKINTEDAKFCFGCGSPLSRTPPVKVEVKSPIAGSPLGIQSPPTASIRGTRQVPSPGSCYYHPDLPSAFVCSRCGRPICAGCNKPYGMLSFCPECYWGLAPKLGAQASQPTPYPQYSGYPPIYQQGVRRSIF